MIICKSFEECLPYWPKVLFDNNEYLGFVVGKTTEVHYGFDKDIDFEYCDKHNIPYYNLQRNGGTIVSAAGNLSIGFLYNNRKRGAFILGPILRDLSKYLATKGLSATIDKNDLLVDGCKVASTGGYNFDKLFHRTYETFQVSINQDLEAINNICKKPMIKVPKGLSEYGITTEEMVEWCSKWLKEHLDIDVTDDKTREH